MDAPRRIASLVPSATECLFALGFGPRVVAVTHECDWPEAARSLPTLTRSVVPDGLPPAEVDAAVRELTAAGRAIYELDSARLEELAPDLIVTQAVCAVCAVSYDDVCNVAGGLSSEPEVVSLDPATLGDVLGDLPRLAAACGDAGAGTKLRGDLESRLEAVRAAVEGAARPTVAALEWLDPPYIGGHWVPEMIALAGGADPLGEAGAKSRTASWEELAVTAPDLAVVMPCGMYAESAAAQARECAAPIRELRAREVWAVDAASSFSRPGPRLVDGVELLAHILHPGLVAAPSSLTALPLPDLAAAS